MLSERQQHILVEFFSVFATLDIVILLIYYYYIITIIYFNCKGDFTGWQWCYNKTQHTNNTYHTKQHTTLKRNSAHKTTHTIKDTLHRINTITTTII
jgi:hypothetical protein